MPPRAARLPARVDASGNLISLLDQDRSQWDQQLLAEGSRFLELSAAGSDLTQYHVEAAIASVHACARSTEDTDWKAIASLYDTLRPLWPSPIVGLNRAIAVAQHEGPERGLREVQSIDDGDRLTAYPFYFAALGDLELRLGRARPRANIFERRSPWRATRLSAAISTRGLPLASVTALSGAITTSL